MTGPLIRQATHDDLVVLHELDHVARTEADRRAAIDVAVAAGRAWVVDIAQCVIGYGIVSHEFFGRSFIDLIYIEQSQRSRGFGPALIRHIEQHARSRDIFTSTNESNQHMRYVLEQLGYEPSGIIYNLDPGDPEIVYVKQTR